MKLKTCCAALFLGALLVCANGVQAAEFSSAQMKRMSVFLSNFTELSLTDFEAKTLFDELPPETLIRFGVWHNYRNNFKGTIKRCTVEHCQWGSLTIDGTIVRDTIRRYFAYDLDKLPSIDQGNMPFHYDGTRYHFEGADGDPVYFARVREARKTADGMVRMCGEIYNADNEKEIKATFTATARPSTWKGKDTWSIVSMKTTPTQ